ncbi:MAG TPA: PBP1A family penicillin-binding protein [Bacillota bacterium]
MERRHERKTVEPEKATATRGGRGPDKPGDRVLRVAVPVLIALAAGVVIVFAALIFLVRLPTPQTSLATRILDVNGNLVGRVAVENRTEVPQSDLPMNLQNATVAVEDDRFFSHHGVDPRGIIRAAYRNLLAGRVVEGASTITQQLVRNLYLTQTRTFSRKIQEALLAIKFESVYTKREILAMYLNTIFFGQSSYGAEVASETYFGKPVHSLDLAQSTMLAGIIRSPENYNPFTNLSAATGRRSLVLDKMVVQGYITAKQATETKSEPVVLNPTRAAPRAAPYFIDYVTKQIAERHPDIAKDLAVGGYTVETTLDLKMQAAGETAFKAGMPAGSKDSAGITQPQGALVAIDPTNGYIKAMIGGRNFGESQFNRAYQAKRQPGSSFKPFLYTAVLDHGYTVVDRQVCEPVSFPGVGRVPYEPQDYGNEPYHYQAMTLRRAVKISDNVIAVRWANTIGPAQVVKYAHLMGIQSYLEPNLSIALGSYEVSPLEMAVGYSTLAGGGNLTTPLAILRLRDRNGKIIEENRPSVSQVVDPRVAYVMTNVMQSVFEPGGTGSNLTPIINRPAAGKTGTTEDYRDAWFAGFTPDLVAAVYVGNDDPRAPVTAPGGRLAGPIWANFIRLSLADVPPHDFIRPPGVIDVQVCADSGLLPGYDCPVVTEIFVAGTEPTQVDVGQGYSPGARGLTGGGAPAPGGTTTPSTPPAITPRQNRPGRRFTWPW